MSISALSSSAPLSKPNKFKYNSKEEQAEFDMNLYDFNARMYDAQLGRFANIDPHSDSYLSFTPYNYAFNNPMLFNDPTGMDGEYYTESGEYIGSDGIDDDKVYVAEKQEDVVHENGTTTRFTSPTNARELDVTHTEFLLLASTSYGESATDNNQQEVYGVASAILNNKELRGDNATITSTINGFALAATDGNERVGAFNNASSEARNGTFMQTAIAGAINAIEGGQDFSNGASHWAGNDIGSPSEKRARYGLLFTNTAHDLQSLGSLTTTGAPISTRWELPNGKPGGPRGTYSYIYETTAAISTTRSNGYRSGTTFMRKTDNYIRATGSPRY